MALPRCHRLRKNKEFLHVRMAGRSVSSPILHIMYTPNETDKTHIGFSISKRISKLAVLRNRYKRRMSEATRLLLPRILPGYDIVISAKPSIMHSSYQELAQNIAMLLSKAHLLREIGTV